LCGTSPSPWQNTSTIVLVILVATVQAVRMLIKAGPLRGYAAGDFFVVETSTGYRSASGEGVEDPMTLVEAIDEIERLRSAVEAIKQAVVEGRVCDDVAWFDTITTLHDFCEQTLLPR
jgi:hypothetical protein